MNQEEKDSINIDQDPYGECANYLIEEEEPGHKYDKGSAMEETINSKVKNHSH